MLIRFAISCPLLYLALFVTRIKHAMITTSKTCLSCGKNLRGRTDKKFCNDQCRNVYNNSLNGDTNNFMRNTDHRNRKNRRILQQLLGGRQVVKIPSVQLNSQGFSFRHFTHTYVNRRGHTYKFCYEYGYMLMEKDRVAIIKKDHEAVRMEREEEEI